MDLNDEAVAALIERIVTSIRGALREEALQLYTVAETAKRLSCHPNTVWNLIKDGDLIPTWVTPRAPRIDAAQLKAFVRSRTG